MFKIIYTPSGTVNSEYSDAAQAEEMLSAIQTNSNDYIIIEVPDGDN